MENQALEQDFENEIERKNANNKQVGQIVSSINNIYITCQILTQAQSTKKDNKPVETNPSGEDSS